MTYSQKWKRCFHESAWKSSSRSSLSAVNFHGSYNLRNKLVRENDLFSPGKSGKSQGKWILQSSRNHDYHTGPQWAMNWPQRTRANHSYFGRMAKTKRENDGEDRLQDAQMAKRRDISPFLLSSSLSIHFPVVFLSCSNLLLSSWHRRSFIFAIQSPILALAVNISVFLSYRIHCLCHSFVFYIVFYVVFSVVMVHCVAFWSGCGPLCGQFVVRCGPLW